MAPVEAADASKIAPTGPFSVGVRSSVTLTSSGTGE